MSKRTVFPLLALATVFAACSSTEGRKEVEGGASTPGPGSGGSISIGTGGAIGNTGGNTDISTRPPSADCGDGKVDRKTEACDDGNNADGDGCYGNCLGIEAGYTCPKEGELCRPFARCGDGVVSFPEQCDDGGVEAGNGCSATCKFELGYKCEGSPSVCTPTVCGDKQIEGAETCDDGNKAPFDGCSPDCIAEPKCDGGPCTSDCGDGIVLGEECDDGNKLDGDGCSSTCKAEPGYTCTQDTTCEKVNNECVLRVPTVFRDFGYGGDFNNSSCAGTSSVRTGILKDTLVSGKPVQAKSEPDECNSHFADWYNTKAGTNVEYVSEIVLYDDGSGNYVNRYGKNGEKWVTKLGWPCSTQAGGCPADGNPFFFPVDGIPGALSNGGETAAVSTTEYGMDGTTYTEQQLTGSAPLHNFAFTSEVAYWFAYNAAVDAQLKFVGDDDVWVFINNKLAVDLGGLHSGTAGSVTLNDATATKLGLEDGKVYEIKVFHAERMPKGSTFKLTLSNFSTGRSDCNAKCGDGIIAFGEECDDGVNDGGYNECGAGCKLGSYCGDGKVDPGEDCDDGNRIENDACGNACRNIIVR